MCKDKKEETAMVVQQQAAVPDFVYSRMTGSPIEAAQTMGAALAKSKLFGVDNPEQGMVLALEAMHQQRSIMDLARKYHVIKGRLSMRADAMQAEFQSDGGRIVWTENTPAACEAQFSHPQFQPEPVPVRWTMEDAKRAGLTGGNWKSYPRQMLRARVISEGVRMVHPGILVGVYTPEEVQDFEPVKAVRATVTKAAEPAEPPKPETPEQKAEREEREHLRTLPTRAQKTLAKLSLVGVTRDDAEYGTPCGVGKPAEAWDGADYDELFARYSELKDKEGDELAEALRGFFRADGPDGE
jgi:hypothetical protein